MANPEMRCPTCGFTGPAGHVHTCSPQVCPKCGNAKDNPYVAAGWAVCLDDYHAPTRPEGLDFLAAKQAAGAEDNDDAYQVLPFEAALNAQHFAALDALRAEYQEMEDAVRSAPLVAKKLKRYIEDNRHNCGCGRCVNSRGGGQHHNGPCLFDGLLYATAWAERLASLAALIAIKDELYAPLPPEPSR